MRSMVVAGIFALALGGAPSPCSGAAGTHSFEFLRVSIAPRPAAMGGAFTALSDGMAGLDWNPAGLSRIGDSEAVAAYMRYPQDVQGGWVALGRSIPSGWRFGISVKYLSYGCITRTTVTDPAGQRSGDFTASDVAVTFGVAYPLAAGVRVGMGATYVSGSIDSYRADAGGVDLGVLYDLVPGTVRLGASVRNLQVSGSAYMEEDVRLPTEGRIGIGIDLPSGLARVAADASFADGDGMHLATGAEVVLGGSLSFRAGMDGGLWDLGQQADGWGSLSALSWGFGVTSREWALDYCIRPFGGFGTVHRLSVRSAL